MGPTKIHLSEEESMLVKNAGWILTKNRIILKVCELFGEVAGQMKTEWDEMGFPEGIGNSRAKISKGEHFRGLPYVVLDFPKEFEKENILAIRTLFWWGNYFSISLHLKGRYKEQFIARIRKNSALLAGNGFLLCIADDEWSHALDPAQYIALASISGNDLESIFAQRPFLKLSARIEFSLWDQLEPELIRHFQILAHALKD